MKECLASEDINNYGPLAHDQRDGDFDSKITKSEVSHIKKSQNCRCKCVQSPCLNSHYFIQNLVALL